MYICVCKIYAYMYGIGYTHIYVYVCIYVRTYIPLRYSLDTFNEILFLLKYLRKFVYISICKELLLWYMLVDNFDSVQNIPIYFAFFSFNVYYV